MSLLIAVGIIATLLLGAVFGAMAVRSWMKLEPQVVPTFGGKVMTTLVMAKAAESIQRGALLVATEDGKLAIAPVIVGIAAGDSDPEGNVEVWM